MTTFKKNRIICLLFLIAIVSCNQHKDYNATQSCSNLKFHAHTIFPDENIIIKFNKEVILNETIKSKQQGYYLDKSFCLPKENNCVVSVISSLGSKTYIDSSFYIKDFNYGYHLIISMPHPVNWKDYYKDGFPPKQWGYLSIDSCTRFVSLIPDSLYKNFLEY